MNWAVVVVVVDVCLLQLQAHKSNTETRSKARTHDKRNRICRSNLRACVLLSALEFALRAKVLRAPEVAKSSQAQLDSASARLTLALD